MADDKPRNELPPGSPESDQSVPRHAARLSNLEVTDGAPALQSSDDPSARTALQNIASSLEPATAQGVAQPFSGETRVGLEPATAQGVAASIGTATGVRVGQVVREVLHGTLNSSEYNTTQFNAIAPSAGILRFASEPPTVAIRSQIEVEWERRSREIMAQMSSLQGELEHVRRTLSDLEARGVSWRAQGIGHNNPPWDQTIEPVEIMADAASALVALKEEAPKRIPSNSVLELCASVIKRAGKFFAWLGGLGKTFVEEAVKSAGQKTGTAIVSLVAFWAGVNYLGAHFTTVASYIDAFLHFASSLP